MIFDTDVLIWFLKGRESAAALIEAQSLRCLSIISYMELIAGVRSKQELRLLKNSLESGAFHIIPLSENIGHRASILLEDLKLGTGLGISDSLIAATALEQGYKLATCNEKHFKKVPNLDLKILHP